MSRPGAWEPGQSGNPKGRPKTGKTWAEIYAATLDEVGDDGLTRKERIVAGIVKMLEDNAGPGEDKNNHIAIKALQIIMDRMDGRPAQSMSLTGADASPLRIDVQFVTPEDGDAV